jgi:hypothetical protein
MSEFSEFFPDGILTLENGIEIQRLTLLFSANELKSPMACLPYEAAISIKTMREWLPTAAFACESGRTVRELFSSDSIDSGVNP